MKLFHSPRSPFVKKVLVVAWELGVGPELEPVVCRANHIDRDRTIIAHNPLGQVPTLLLEDGGYLADTRVICEYLNHRFSGTLYPEPGPARWEALRLDALAHGMMDAGVLAGLEMRLRPPEFYYAPWAEGQAAKLHSGVDALEGCVERLSGTVDIAAISIGCCLSFIDRRLGHVDWRSDHPKLAAWLDEFETRESMRQTRVERI